MPQAGLVKIDGQDLKELDLAHLRTQIGVVLQENFCFRARCARTSR
jgi:ATP-binding cassette subfamily B protein